MNLLITLCARGGSKGIKGKNIKLLNGKPLIGYSIDIAKKISKAFNGEIGLSTDDASIKQTAAEMGLGTEYTRPDYLATDQAGKIETIADLLSYHENLTDRKFDYVLDLDVTSPLRTVSDIVGAFEIFYADKNALNLFSVSPASRNPYFNMVEKKENGYYGLVKKGEFLTRQSAPDVFELNASFYFYRRTFFEGPVSSTITERSLIYKMPHICFDLDHEVDFEFMEFLLQNNKLGFEL